MQDSFKSSRSSRALLPDEHRAAQRALFLKRYAQEGQFCGGLINLYNAHRALFAVSPDSHQWSREELAERYPAALARHRTYVQATDTFASRWRLDLFEDRAGYEAINLWCAYRARYGDDDPGASPQRFGFNLPHACRMVRDASPPLPFALLPWDIHETDTDFEAKNRVAFEEHLRRERQRIATHRESVGYQFIGTDTKVRRVVDWTFRRFVLDEDASDIARAEKVTHRTVGNETNRCAQAIRFRPIRRRKRTI